MPPGVVVDDSGMFALRFGNVARVEVALLLLCGSRCQRGRGREKQQDALTHMHLRFDGRISPDQFERRMTRAGSYRWRGGSADGQELGSTLGNELLGPKRGAAVQLLQNCAL